ncbi:uncharacterized protein DS421_13g406120 [Arachis hypogaea]|nr:uncharacterized protein DS421_13g406120 [Arachis hypogaea]
MGSLQTSLHRRHKEGDTAVVVLELFNSCLLQLFSTFTFSNEALFSQKETLAYNSLHRRSKEGDSVTVRRAVVVLELSNPIHSNRSFFVEISVRRLVYLYSFALLLPSIVVLVA